MEGLPVKNVQSLKDGCFGLCADYFEKDENIARI